MWGREKERMKRKSHKNSSCLMVSVDSFPKSPNENIDCQSTYLGHPVNVPRKASRSTSSTWPDGLWALCVPGFLCPFIYMAPSPNLVEGERATRSWLKGKT